MEDYRDKIRSIYNNFDGKNLSLLDNFYDENVVFQDPMVSLVGRIDLKSYYKHSYQNVKNINFQFTDILRDENKYSASWIMKIVVAGLNQGREYTVNGVSVLHFNESGMVIYHRDYLDMGEMIYEHIPLQGFIIKKIKNKLSQFNRVL